MKQELEYSFISSTDESMRTNPIIQIEDVTRDRFLVITVQEIYIAGHYHLLRRVFVQILKIGLIISA